MESGVLPSKTADSRLEPRVECDRRPDMSENDTNMIGYGLTDEEFERRQAEIPPCCAENTATAAVEGVECVVCICLREWHRIWDIVNSRVVGWIHYERSAQRGWVTRTISTQADLAQKDRPAD